MLLTITSTAPPATDLGYLLHKNPARAQSFALGFGTAHVFYPEAGAERCTAALLLEVDPVGLVRGRRDAGGGDGLMDQYVNDRPYVASSLFSVALAEVYRSALAGKCRDRPEVVERPLPLEARLAALPCRGGEGFLRRLFEPLGYEVDAVGHPLDAAHPEWGVAPTLTVTLRGEKPLRELLAHLYVLIPVLDDRKHYYVGAEEMEKLLRHGEGWLAAHPAREEIALRYLKRQRSLVREAIARLAEDEGEDHEGEGRLESLPHEGELERRISLNEQRIGAVLAVLKASGAGRVLDLGCGEGRLLQALLGDHSFTEIVGVDISYATLERASERLHLDRMPPKQRERIRLLHGALTYRDRRLTGYDAAAVVEVIEHLDPPRLAAFERVLFECARPGTVVVTTPNAEYNVRWERLPAGEFRHRDHRFEWTRAQFQAWAGRMAARFGYTVRFLPVGPEDPGVGPPTQMGVFSR